MEEGKKRLSELRESIEEFVGRNLDSSIPKTTTKCKIINDTYWGNVTLFDWEVDLINQPIIQRLRQIKQTGSAYMVYPTANHSRFEHSIGTLAVLVKIIEKVNSKRALYGMEKEIEPSIYLVLRLAAILHDVGHSFFSHISESMQTYTKDFNDCWRNIKKELEKEYQKDVKQKLKDNSIKEIPTLIKEELGLKIVDSKGKKNKQFFEERLKVHEILSSLIIESDNFKRFFKKIIPIGFFKDNTIEGFLKKNEDEIVNIIISMISKSILGIPPLLFQAGKRLVVLSFMSNLINGALDVDKLDYLARDNYCAGLAVKYDIERFLNKVIIYEEIITKKEKHEIRFDKMVVDIGASHVFDQILIGKMMLHFYIYHHHKVLTCDKMIMEICTLLTNEIIKNDKYCLIKHPIDLFDFIDSDFSLNIQGLKSKINELINKIPSDLSLSSIEQDYIKINLNIARELLLSYSKRKLFSRCIVIYPAYLEIEENIDEINSMFTNVKFKKEIGILLVKLLIWFDNNWNSTKGILEKKKIEENIIYSYHIIDQCKKTFFKFQMINSFFHIIVPKPPTGDEAEDITYVKWPEKEKIEYRFPINHWIKAYVSHKWAVYVVSREEFRILINIITRYQLMKERQWNIKSSSAIDSHLQTNNINCLNRLFISLSSLSSFHFPLEKDLLEKIMYK